MNSLELIPTLLVKQKSLKQIFYLQNQPFYIGRHSGCSLTMKSRCISRHHATIIPKKNQRFSFYIIDGLPNQESLSTNGFMVNNEPCLMHELKSGDHIIFPDGTQITYQLQEKALVKAVNSLLINRTIKDFESLALIDHQYTLNQKFEPEKFSPSEYELVRRIIQLTGDWEYANLLQFRSEALSSGAQALAKKTPIIVDTLMMQRGITDALKNTFANPIYCAEALTIKRKKNLSDLALSLKILTKHYPEAIVIIAQETEALTAILALLESQTIKPALIIATPSWVVDVERLQKRLSEFVTPYIYVDGSKENVAIAVTLFNGLLDLAWQLYEENTNNLALLNQEIK